LPEAARAAVFLDRDGTIIEDAGYIHDPDAVRLLPGAADGLSRLAARGYPLVVVSNQSGIARGLFGPGAFQAVNERLGAILAPHGVRFAACYHCPHHPDITGPCECRKPGVALFRRAAAEQRLDLERSWYVGNRLHDVEPALTLGGRGILLTDRATTSDVARAAQHGIVSTPDLRGAAEEILRADA